MKKSSPKSGSPISSRKSDGSSSGKPRGGNNANDKSPPASERQASREIDDRIRSLEDWRGEALAEIRRLILEVGNEIFEECKWNGTPVWSSSGIICTGETYKQVVKLTFARGASLKDPHQLFNASLEGRVRRAIDIREGEQLEAKAFKSLIRAAIEENLRIAATRAKPSKQKQTARATGSSPRPAPRKTSERGPVVLLSGGNPQIAKAEGDAPVQAYIAAMPDWKSPFGKQLDELITREVPEVKKAVKWNSPFYGIEGQGWFLSFHVFTRYVKVTFFAGTALRPVPPGGTERSKEVRWIDIYEADGLDEAQMERWIKQAAAIPGWIP